MKTYSVVSTHGVERIEAADAFINSDDLLELQDEDGKAVAMFKNWISFVVVAEPA